MTKHLFSIRVGHTSLTPDLCDYLERLKQVQQGVHDLLEPIRLNSQVVLRKKVCQEGGEWLDVRLSPGIQLSFINELEETLGSELNQLDIECQVAQMHTNQAMQLLRELHARRTWQTTDFLEAIYRRKCASNITKVGRQMDSGEGSVQIQFAHGKTASASLPNRRFSAMQDVPVQLLFRADQVGLDRAIVRLSKDAQLRIGAKCRRIEASWHDPFGYEMSERIYQATKAQNWIAARCRVVVNGTGKPKGLLIETIDA